MYPTEKRNLLHVFITLYLLALLLKEGKGERGKGGRGGGEGGKRG